MRVSAFWGETCLDTNLVHEGRDLYTGPRHDEGKHSVWAPLDLSEERFTFLTHSGRHRYVVIPEGGEAWLEKGDDAVPTPLRLAPCDLPSAVGVHHLLDGERVVVRHGPLTLAAEWAESSEVLAPSAARDWGFARIVLISLLVHGFFALGSLVTPRFSDQLGHDMLITRPDVTDVIFRRAEPEKPRPKLELSGAKGSPAKDEAGLIGRKDRPQKDTMASKAGAPRVDPNKRERDRRIVMQSGLLGMLGAQGRPTAVDSVLGTREIGAGLNQALGGLSGVTRGDAGGAGGLASRGTESGGGGGPLGIGGLGGGPRRGAGGPSNVDLGGPGKHKTTLLPGPTIVRGALSKEEIGRVIRQNLSRFKFCYEKELNANVGLSGKVSVYFSIAPTGAVAENKVRESSLRHAGVEGCVLSVLKSLRFPPPRGGGVVVVTYPFIFQST